MHRTYAPGDDRWMGYKVPFRQIWCETRRGWLRETIFCHVVLRLFASDIDQITERPQAPPGGA